MTHSRRGFLRALGAAPVAAAGAAILPASVEAAPVIQAAQPITDQMRMSDAALVINRNWEIINENFIRLHQAMGFQGPFGTGRHVVPDVDARRD